MAGSSVPTMVVASSPGEEQQQTERQDDEGQAEARSTRQPDFSLIVQRGSLLILRDAMYNDYLHGIVPRTNDTVAESMVNYAACGVQLNQTFERKTRISLTFRVVEKVAKGKFF